VPVALALHVAEIADNYRSARHSHPHEKHHVPVSYHFVTASSAGRKGRILCSAVTFFRPKIILEVGTAYGISSVFMGHSQKAVFQSDEAFRLYTLEGFEPQAGLCRELLSRELEEHVHCTFGKTDVALRPLAETAGDIHLAFHDAGHTYDDYVNDFNKIVDRMAAGSVLMLDDIRWNDPRYVTGNARTYEGWQTVVSHPRVKRAVEIDRAIGMALLE